MATKKREIGFLAEHDNNNNNNNDNNKKSSDITDALSNLTIENFEQYNKIKVNKSARKYLKLMFWMTRVFIKNNLPFYNIFPLIFVAILYGTVSAFKFIIIPAAAAAFIIIYIL